jgi:hypothetical protein
MTQAYTNRFTEVHELTGFAVDNVAVGTYTTLNYRSMATHQRGVAIIIVGEMGVGSTVDFALVQATDVTGTGVKAIAGKAITQLSQAAGDGNDACIIEVRTEELDVDNGFAFISAVLTVAGAASDIAVIGLSGGSNYVPVPVTNWTEVVD